MDPAKPISALIVLLVVAVGFIYRQMQRLSAARNKLGSL